MHKQTFLAAGLAVAFSWATPAAADTIFFDYNGTAGGGAIQATVFDWAPGNALFTELTPTAASFVYQANLNVIQAAVGNGFLNGTDLNYFTAVAEYDVSLTSNTATSIAYNIVPGSGTLRIYYDDQRASDLLGTEFAAGGGALEILTSTITSGSGGFNFTTSAPSALDSFLSSVTPAAGTPEPGGNNYPGIVSLTGTGAATLSATVTAFNSNFFLDLLAGQSLAFTNASQIDPYNQANPSQMFFDGTVGASAANAALCGANPGGICVNGTGTVIISQSDANTEFVNTQQQVPEPASLTLLGLGLAGTVIIRRRQKKATTN